MRHRRKKNGKIEIDDLTAEMLRQLSSPMSMVIIGAGIFLREMIQLVAQSSEFDIVGILDPDQGLHGQMIHSIPVLGWLESMPEEVVNAVVGTPSTAKSFDREAVFHIMRKRGVNLPILRSVDCRCDKEVPLRTGTVLMAGSVTKQGANIGDNCIVGPDSVIGEGVILESHSVVTFREKLSYSNKLKSERITPKSMAAAFAHENETIQEIIRRINWANMEIMLITDEKDVLTGTVTDGDIRRGILAGIELDCPVSLIMNRNPLTVPIGTSHSEMFEIMKEQSIRHLPVVDSEMRPVRLEMMEALFNDLQGHDALVMAGGLGERLGTLTKTKPKPLLSVGGRTILDHILSGIHDSGLDDVVLSVRYMEDKIRDHVGDGSKHDLNVAYLSEKDRLGTAGALSMIRPRPRKPFLMMNGDLVTSLDYSKLLRFQKKHGYKIVMCVRNQKIEMAYGVVDIKEGKVSSLHEKPVYNNFINAGIYVVDPDCIDLVPKGEYFDMPDLINAVLARNEDVGAFPVIEYWRDIGSPEDLKIAKNEKENLIACGGIEELNSRVERMTA